MAYSDRGLSVQVFRTLGIEVWGSRFAQVSETSARLPVRSSEFLVTYYLYGEYVIIAI